MPIEARSLPCVAWIAAAVAVVGLMAGAALAQSKPKEEFRIKRHFKIERPAKLSNAEALSIYENIGAELATGYGASRDRTAEEFRKWRRYNSAPYRSATHGNRYVNNYANAKAAGYGKKKVGARMPPGAVFAKDSFTVTADGGVFGGALFVMEKMAAGALPGTADWRYAMILPDGSYFGDTTGENAGNVAFCHGCHMNVKDDDYLFFVPKAFRRNFLGD